MISINRFSIIAVHFLLAVLVSGCGPAPAERTPASQPQSAVETIDNEAAPEFDLPVDAPADIEPAPLEAMETLLVAAPNFSVYAGDLGAPCVVFVQTAPSPNTIASWNFGDPSGAYNTHQGFFAAHVYDKPGTYTIRLQLTAGGSAQTFERQIVVVADARKTIEVSDSAALLNACKSLRDNTTILLKRGQTFEIAESLLVRSRNVRFGAAGNGAAPIVRFRGADWKGAFELSPASANVVIENLDFNLRSKNFAANVFGVQALIRNCTVDVGGGLTVARGVANLLVDNCGHIRPTDRGFFYAGGIGRANQNVIVRRSWSAGSKYEHCIRIHNTRSLLVQDCTFDNRSSAQGKQSLNLRDGSDFHVLNSKLLGPSVFGPLADKSGGLYDPPGKERDRKLSLRLSGLIVEKCSFDGYAILEAGLSDFLFRDCSISASKSGSCFSAQGSYGPRKEPTGTFLRVRAFYEGGKLLSGPGKGIKILESEFSSSR